MTAHFLYIGDNAWHQTKNEVNLVEAGSKIFVKK